MNSALHLVAQFESPVASIFDFMYDNYGFLFGAII
jgi:hypothetical protein